MSVERTGPQGYEFQYLVSVYFALDNIEKNNIEIYIEKEEGEDAEISYLDEGVFKVYDIQVKGYSSQLDVTEYCKWISHFVANSSDTNLIDKLNDNNDRQVIFVTSARCKDEVSLFAKDSVYEQNDIPINSSVLDNIKENIISSFNENTKLSAKRKEYCRKQLQIIKTEELKNVLRRMIILERCNKVDLENKIKGILNTSFLVPQSMTNNVLLRLYEVVRAGRDSRKNIQSNIKSIIGEFIGNRVFLENRNDIERSEYKQCMEMIEKEGVLLLTGISLCGKTHIAKKVAQECQNRGYNIKITQDIHGDGAYAFLNHISSEDRICILEDPFGYIALKEDSNNIYSNIIKLIRELQQHRKLIITTRIDLLFKVTGRKDLKECAINGNSWIELTLHELEIFKRIWTSYFSESKESLELLDKVLTYAERIEGGSYLQAGQVAHLSSLMPLSDLLNLPIEEVTHMARYDSNGLALSLQDRGDKCKELIAALGVGTNTITPINIEDLAFILNTEEEYPTIYEERKNWTGIGYGGYERSEPVFPTYKTKLVLDEGYKKELQYLEEHRYIIIDKKNKSIVFKHPSYYECAKYIFIKGVSDFLSCEKYIFIARKGLSTINKEIPLNTIRFLESIYFEINDNQDKQLVRGCIFKAIYSIFPSVKDRVISFLIRNFMISLKNSKRNSLKILKQESQ